MSDFWRGVLIGGGFMFVLDIVVVAFLAWEYTRGRGPKQ